MKLVIEMPEEDYRRLKEDKYNEHPDSALTDLEILVNAFHNGTPLDNIISQIEQARDKDKLCEYPYNRCIEILRRATEE